LVDDGGGGGVVVVIVVGRRSMLNEGGSLSLTRPGFGFLVLE
jgi:hypothetical protein